MADKLTHLTAILDAQRRQLLAYRKIAVIDEKAGSSERELQVDIVNISLAEIALDQAEIAIIDFTST